MQICREGTEAADQNASSGVEIGPLDWSKQLGAHVRLKNCHSLTKRRAVEVRLDLPKPADAGTRVQEQQRLVSRSREWQSSDTARFTLPLARFKGRRMRR